MEEKEERSKAGNSRPGEQAGLVKEEWVNGLWLQGGNDGGTEQNEAPNVFVEGDKRSVCSWNQLACQPASENRHF